MCFLKWAKFIWFYIVIIIIVHKFAHIAWIIHGDNLNLSFYKFKINHKFKLITILNENINEGGII